MTQFLASKACVKHFDNTRYLTFSLVSSPSTSVSLALAGGGPGNIENGDHGYKVTYITQNGETTGSTSSIITVIDDTVSITNIPISSDPRVYGRKIYRTEANETTYKFLITINDNSTTSYIDNISDASLGAEEPTTNNTETKSVSSLLLNGDIIITGKTIDSNRINTINGSASTINATGNITQAQLISGIIICEPTAGNITLTLPTAANLISFLHLDKNGHIAEIKIINAGINNVIIQENGGADANNSINGGTNYTINAGLFKTLLVRRASSTTTTCHIN